MNKKIIVGILVIIFVGLAIFTFASPKEKKANTLEGIWEQLKEEQKNKQNSNTTNNLLTEEQREEINQLLEDLKSGKISIHDVFKQSIGENSSIVNGNKESAE